jgi:iron complex transport system ATP-binding protein
MSILQHLAHDEQKTIIIATHDINNAIKFSDKLVLLKKGKIIAHGNTEHAINNSNIRDLYGSNVKLTTTLNGETVIDSNY